jgi:hypothetical protein
VYQRALPHESRAWPGMPDSHPSWRPQAMRVLSEIDGEALCYPAFSQAVSIRERRRDGGEPRSFRYVATVLRPGAGQVGRVHRMTETMYAPSAKLRSIHQTDDSGFSRKRVAKYLNRFLLTDVGD